MYKPLAETISQTFKQGIAVLPSEAKATVIKKISPAQFFALDYRVSNSALLALDSESHSNGDGLISDEISHYILGFALVRNIQVMPELATVPRTTVTRLKNKIYETMANVFNQSHVRKNRGQRATYIERNGFYPNQTTVNNTGASPANCSDWLLIPFVLSTTIFYNDFRANLRVGEKDGELSNVFNDVQTRLKNELDTVRDNFNKKLATPISGDLLAKVFLVSPNDIMEDKFVSDIFEYVDSKFVSPKKTKSLVDTPDDDDFIPIPGVSLGGIKAS